MKKLIKDFLVTFVFNKTAWVPLTTYRFGDATRIVLFRKNFRTGMLYFKTKKINGTNCTKHLLPISDKYVERVWEEVIKMKDPRVEIELDGKELQELIKKI